MASPTTLIAAASAAAAAVVVPMQVCGLIGLLSRVPLHHQTLLLPTSQAQQQQPYSSSSTTGRATAAAAAAQPSEGGAAAAAAAAAPARLAPEGGRPLGDRARGVLAASATHLDRLVLGSARKLGRSITQDSLLRVFGSAGASLQFGEMRRNVFDFTRVEAVLDLGLNGPEALDQAQKAKSSTGGGARTRAGSSAGKGSKGSGLKGTVRAASPGRGMATILGPAAAAQQPLLLPGGPAAAGSSGSSPASSTAAGGAPHPPSAPTAAGSSSGGSSSAPTRPTAAAAAAALPPLPPAAAGGVGGAVSAAAGGHKHPAFALDERGVWHSLSLSATQQLFGPVRLRADCRLALDSVHSCPRGSGRWRLRFLLLTGASFFMLCMFH